MLLTISLSMIAFTRQLGRWLAIWKSKYKCKILYWLECGRQQPWFQMLKTILLCHWIFSHFTKAVKNEHCKVPFIACLSPVMEFFVWWGRNKLFQYNPCLGFMLQYKYRVIKNLLFFSSKHFFFFLQSVGASLLSRGLPLLVCNIYALVKGCVKNIFYAYIWS